MEKIVKRLEDGYSIIEMDTRDVDFLGVAGWISYWIVDKYDEKIETFCTVKRAEEWWDRNKETVGPAFEANAEKLAKKFVRQMGLKWKQLSTTERQEWVDACTD